MATYFVEAEPEDGRLIRYGKGFGDKPELGSYQPVGRWSEEYAAIVTTDLKIRDISGTQGYCWEYVTGEVIPAQVK